MSHETYRRVVHLLHAWWRAKQGMIAAIGYTALLADAAPTAQLATGTDARAHQSRPQPCEVLDPGAEGWRLSFDEEFDNLDLFDGRRGRWQTHFLWGERSISTNREMQLYVDPNLAGVSGTPLGLNPFTLRNGKLVISAWKADRATLAELGGFRYLSGLLTTAQSFQQTYGYFEIRAKMPRGSGLWPAFWLLPPSGIWPPEIDVFEAVGRDPTKIFVSVHSAESGQPKGTVNTVMVPDTSADFHSYGVLWTPDRLAWFFDRCRVAEVATPADLHGPMYMLVNLAVGGSWVGVPDRHTRFPAELEIDRIRAFSLR